MMLTIFTPTYNRSATLPRLYESLLRQSCYDFEWLVIDDGSNDDTERILSSFFDNGHFPVRYIHKENGGKHTAHNLALTLARGDWFLCLDSDDFLAGDGVLTLLDAATRLSGNTGIASYKADLDGKLLGGPFPENLERCTLVQLGTRCGGEFTLAFPTAFARQFPFPVFAGERFITESVVYDRMDRSGTMVLLPRVTTICQYQSEGYSQNTNRLMKQNPNGFCLYFLQRIDLQPSLLSRLICGGKYHCFRMICKNPSLVYHGSHQTLVRMASLLGPVFRIYYRLFRKI